MDRHSHCCPRSLRTQLLSPVTHKPCCLSFGGKSSWHITIWKYEELIKALLLWMSSSSVSPRTPSLPGSAAPNTDVSALAPNHPPSLKFHSDMQHTDSCELLQAPLYPPDSFLLPFSLQPADWTLLRSGKRCISVDAWFIRALLRGQVVMVVRQEVQIYISISWAQLVSSCTEILQEDSGELFWMNRKLNSTRNTDENSSSAY